MVPLSVVIITLNEEKNIGRCIDSVKEIADDIVVVDSFSTDKTKEICIAKAIRFVEQDFLGYIEQKNFANTQAKYPHILSLDADEALSPELIQSIKNIKSNWKADGYTMYRLTNYCGKWIYHCGWYPDTKLRLWDSRKGKWTGINPHDRFEMRKDAAIFHLNGNLLHYSYYTFDDHLQQVQKFSTVAAKAMHEKGIKSSICKILFKPLARFIKIYIVKQGFRDGYYGYLIARVSSFAVFLKYVKLFSLQKGTKSSRL
ncbi:MAG: glycosyltransferase family 2 protein [Lentimicrobiaceae bacterium]|nr:glycosyltransferase family 2 protein [Lentimicrobiaceae bacterium]